MIDFDSLSYQEQVNVLTDAALTVLNRHWGIHTPVLTCIQHFQNSTFRVDVHPSGQRYALRINRPNSQNAATIKSELFWLAALGRDTDLHIPVPVPTTDGALFIESTTHGLTRVYTLFHWLDGKMLDDALTLSQLESVGVFMGKLHNHSARWTPPYGFTRKALEWDGQMHEHYTNIAVNGSAVVTPQMWDIFVHTRRKVEPPMNGLGKSPQVYGLIHNDIYQKNMLFVGDSVRVLDFDNCGWGHYLLDIAVTLAKLITHTDYPAKRDALLRGYRSQRVLSDAHAALIDTFIAARILLLALYLAGQMSHPGMRDTVPDFVRDSAQTLERWLTCERFV